MSTSSLLEAGVLQDLRDTAQQLRVDSVRCSAAGAAGGPLPVARKLAVRSMPGSATPGEQLQLAGIDMAAIATAAAELVAGHAT